MWCKTRLFNSGGQFDQPCNLIGGAILARSTMLAHSQAIIAYGDAWASKVQGVWPYGAVVCAVDFQSKHCGFDPRRVQLHTSFFSFSISGWLPTAKCVCLSMMVLWKKLNCRWPKTATGSCVVQTRLLNSVGQ